MTITLNLTTTVAADCRWTGMPGTPYAQMPNSFQQGQGDVSHSAVVAGLRDLDDLRFYVRCADLAGAIGPDRQEGETHVRILGPWDGGYPRLANLWPNYEPALGVDFYAGYDLLIPNWWPDVAKPLARLRTLNPRAKILRSQNATYGWPEIDKLTSEWWHSEPGDWGYPCLLRDSSGTILLVQHWGHPMYNLVQPQCRAALVRRNLEQFLPTAEDAVDDLAYDGIFWDLLNGSISWLGGDIDSNLDGQPDDPLQLDAAYQSAVADFLSQMRAGLPNAILAGNEAVPAYAPWVNGRLFEWQLWTLLDGSSQASWNEIVAAYAAWTERGFSPRTTFIQGAPASLIGPHGSRNYDEMPPAMQQEAAVDYRRMRFGLTTALMGDGLYYFQYEPTRGQSWWYDEFGAQGCQPASVLPCGYLGQPTGEPQLLVDAPQSSPQIENGDFVEGLAGWGWWVDTDAGAAATLRVDSDGGMAGTPAAHVEVQRAADPWSVLLYYRDLKTAADELHTLSFWARSDMTRTLYAKVAMAPPPGTDYGFSVKAEITPRWQRFFLVDDASATADDGELDLLVGDGAGELWLDDVQFRGGSSGVWARSFDRGLALINTTLDVQVTPLPGSYCKLDAGQAPLFQARVDDDEARASAGWLVHPASNDQFGATIHRALGGSAATITYRPHLAYAGLYRVLAWVAPMPGQSKSASMTINHATGPAVVTFDESIGAVGWRDLGVYWFDAGEAASALLTATGEGNVIADVVKWESVARYNDGSRVSQVTLQPQDGIILLTDCPGDVQSRLYVPLIAGE